MKRRIKQAAWSVGLAVPMALVIGITEAGAWVIRHAPVK